MKTGSIPDLSNLRNILCKVLVLIRSPYDLLSLEKTDLRTMEAVNLGPDFSKGGVFVYLTHFTRFTTVAFKDCIFYEN